ncbi:MAG: PEP-CTERM sorting domain-containing protein [Pseudomonadota bacterium]|nr:PEP-CTERM sorting domain-containing protein [Pseudomonadota bacterium]
MLIKQIPGLLFYPLVGCCFFKELLMRLLLSIAVLMSASVPAFADINVVPEPESLALFAIGAVAMLVAGRRKK